MTFDPDRTSFSRLLDLVGGLRDLDDQIAGTGGALARRRLQARRREGTRLLLRLLGPAGARGLPGWLREIRERHHLDETEVLLLLSLLHRRVAADNPVLTGRDLLGVIAESPSEILRHSARLHAAGRLVKSGLVEARIAQDEGVLEGAYRISERLWRRSYRCFHAPRARRTRRRQPPPYRCAAEHLSDLRVLLTLHQKRAAVLFPHGAWTEVYPDVQERPEDLTDDIASVRELIGSRERATPAEVRLPVRDLRLEQQLSDDEEVILLALLLSELYVASPVIEAGELVRLVSANDGDVVRRRSLLLPSGRLLPAGLVALDADLDDKPLLAGAYLPQWVTDRLLEHMEPLVAIDRKEQARFREWLASLDDSRDFFRNL